jgi:hypothetical protein
MLSINDPYSLATSSQKSDAKKFIKKKLKLRIKTNKIMEALVNTDGITIRQLKELVKDLPEQGDNGEEFELWVTNTDDNCLSNVAKSISRLNRGDLIIDIAL